MNNRNPEEIENIFGENILQNENGIGFNNNEVSQSINQVDESQVQSVQNFENQNIEDVVQNYFTNTTDYKNSTVESSNLGTENDYETIKPTISFDYKPMQNFEYEVEYQPVETPVATVNLLQKVEENPSLETVNPIDNVEQNFDVEDANRETNEHPDAKITLNREEKEQSNEELVTMKDLKNELNNNESLKFILILGAVLFIIIMALPTISNLIK